MRALITEFLGQSPIVTLSVIIAAGYLLGEVSIFGFRLGVAGVLFAGLTLGAIFPSLTLPNILSVLGLVLFVYTMGLQSGSAFFANIRQQGWRNNKLTIVTLVWGTALLQVVAWWTDTGGPKSGRPVHGSINQHTRAGGSSSTGGQQRPRGDLQSCVSDGSHRIVSFASR